MPNFKIINTLYRNLIPAVSPVVKALGLSHHRYIGKRIDRSDVYKETIFSAEKLLHLKGPSYAIQYLQRKMRWLGGRFSGLSQNWWEGLIIASNMSKPIDEGYEKQLIRETLSHDPRILTYEDWIDLYALSLRIGLFRFGSILRDMAKSSIAQFPRKDTKSRRCILGALIDNGKWSEADDLLEHESPFVGIPKAHEHAKWLISRFIHSLQRPHGSESPKNLQDTVIIDQDYLELLNNKTVAIVGPVKPLTDAGGEIDSFDIVIKFNHRTEGQGCDPVTQGRRIDIAYYNGTQTDILIDKHKGTIPDNLKAAVFNSDTLEKIHGVQIKRRINSINFMLFNGNLNAVPNAVYDVLLHRPKIIKIFNADLMLSNNRYKSYRPSKIGRINYTRSCVTHDPATQYNMLCHAWANGLVKGDDRFESIMQMGEKEYMHQLQIIWGTAVNETS